MNLITKKIPAARKFVTPHNFSNGPSLNCHKMTLNGLIIYVNVLLCFVLCIVSKGKQK